MLDTKSIEDIIKDNIQQSVDHYVSSIIGDDAWITEIEQRIVRHVQDRITARFANISSVPDLIETVHTSVINLLSSGNIPGLDRHIDKETIRRGLDHSIENAVQGVVDNLAVDQAWLDKIQRQIDQEFQRRFIEKLSVLDVSLLIKQNIDDGFRRWQDDLKQNFTTTGIRDNASDTQLTVKDSGIDIKDQITAKNIEISQDGSIHGTLSVNNLCVRGSINTDNKSWNALVDDLATSAIQQITNDWREQMIDDVLDRARISGIDFDQVTINGRPLISGKDLHPAITDSNLQTLGTLKDLVVQGSARFNNTLTVNNRRVGINTETPEMALGIWDEEVAVILGKHSHNTGFIGTARSQGLNIGTNRQTHVSIDDEGLTTIKKLRVDRHKVAFESQVPGYNGTRGDIVFNSDPKPGQPFAWQCLGGFKWQSIWSRE